MQGSLFLRFMSCRATLANMLHHPRRQDESKQSIGCQVRRTARRSPMARHLRRRPLATQQLLPRLGTPRPTTRPTLHPTPTPPPRRPLLPTGPRRPCPTEWATRRSSSSSSRARSRQARAVKVKVKVRRPRGSSGGSASGSSRRTSRYRAVADADGVYVLQAPCGVRHRRAAGGKAEVCAVSCPFPCAQAAQEPPPYYAQLSSGGAAPAPVMGPPPPRQVHTAMGPPPDRRPQSTNGFQPMGPPPPRQPAHKAAGTGAHMLTHSRNWLMLAVWGCRTTASSAFANPRACVFMAVDL